MPLKKGAGVLGLTQATARQYVKQVFRKTGVRGQPALVRKVMSLPRNLRLDGGAPGLLALASRSISVNRP